MRAPGPKLLKLKHDELLSCFAFNFNLRRYAKALFELAVVIGGAALPGQVLVLASSFVKFKSPQEIEVEREVSAAAAAAAAGSQVGVVQRAMSGAGAYTRPLFGST